MIRENLSGLTSLMAGGILVLSIVSLSNEYSRGGLEGFFLRVFLLLIPFLLISIGIWLLIWEDNVNENMRMTLWTGGGVFLFAFISLFGVFSLAEVGVIKSDVFGVLRRTAPLTIATGAIIGVLIGSYDVLQHRERRELIAAQKQADRRLERISVLNRVLRHDIRNSINIISGYLEKLETKSDEEFQAEEIIRDQINEILNLSNHSREIEDLIRRDAPKIEETDIAEIAQEKCEEVRQTSEGVEINYNGLESAVIESTPLISSVITNAIENAVEHNDQPIARIDVTVEEVSGEDFAYKITVADNGPGLPDREKKVFEGDRETPLEHSNGMGLWLIRWISREAGGKVTAGDNGSSGTEIAIYLPKIHPQTKER